jgi:hypothetical protein
MAGASRSVSPGSPVSGCSSSGCSTQPRLDQRVRDGLDGWRDVAVAPCIRRRAAPCRGARRRSSCGSALRPRPRATLGVCAPRTSRVQVAGGSRVHVVSTFGCARVRPCAAPVPLFARGAPPCNAGVRSGRLDLNQRPFGPQPNALPDCATPRGRDDLSLPRPVPRAASSVQPLVGEEPGLRRPRDRPQCSHRPALHKWPSGTPWAVFATYVGGVGSPDTRAPCGRLRHSVHVRVTENLRGIGREGTYPSITHEVSVRPA